MDLSSRKHVSVTFQQQWRRQTGREHGRVDQAGMLWPPSCCCGGVGLYTNLAIWVLLGHRERPVCRARPAIKDAAHRMHLGFGQYEGLELHEKDLVHQPEALLLNLQRSICCWVCWPIGAYLIHRHVVCPAVPGNPVIIAVMVQKCLIVLLWKLLAVDIAGHPSANTGPGREW